MVYDLFTKVLLDETFAIVPQVTQMEIIGIIYTPLRLTYQLTTSEFTKLLEFHILRSCLGYTIHEGMV